MKRLLLLVLLFPLSLGAQLLEEPGLESRITLLHQVYRINAEIPVYFTVINAGPKPVTVYPSVLLHRNYRFRVRTLQNVHVKYRDAFFLKIRNTAQDEPLDRPVILMPGERYGRVLDLAEQFDLSVPGNYEVTGYFYAHPMRSGDDSRVESNKARFILQPPPRVAAAVKRYQQERKRHFDRILSPGDTVEFMLTARKAADWDAYFHYLDLVKLLAVYPDFQKRYDAADYAGKPDVLRDFREHLKQFPAGTVESFFAGRTEITKDEMTGYSSARVICRVVTKEGQLIIRRDYYFTLYLKFDRWYVEKFHVVRK